MQPLSVTLIQSKLYWEDKQANLQMFADKINNISEQTEVVILPEMFSTGFSMNTCLAETMVEHSVNWMKKIAVEKRIILTGSLIIKEQDKFYNRMIWALPNGQVGHYDKRHLFSLANENDFYTAGTKRLITQVKGWKINLQICYDLRFPVYVRQSQKTNDDDILEPEYDVIIYVANWPKVRNHAWKTLLIARAIENQCYVIGVNRVGEDGKGYYYEGNSMLVDPMGEVLYQQADIEDIFTTKLDKQKLIDIRAKFGFLKDADDFKMF